MDKEKLSAEFGGLINDFNKGILDKDISTHYGSGSTKDGTPQIYMKDVGTYSFYVLPPFAAYSEDTPWGGRIGLVLCKHWNIKEEDGKVKGTYLDYENCMPWLKAKSPLNAVIQKWKDKGMATEVDPFVSSESVMFNVLLMESPMSEHKQYLATVEDGVITSGSPVVCTLESNLTTLKFLQEQMGNKFNKYPLTDPINGTMIQIVKSKKTVRGGSRITYDRTVGSHSPMWFEGLPIEKQKEAIKTVLGNLPNIYDYNKPDQYTYKDTEAAAKRIDNMLAEKSKYLNDAGSLSTSIPHKDEFSSAPSGFPEPNKQPDAKKEAVAPQDKPKTELKGNAAEVFDLPASSTAKNVGLTFDKTNIHKGTTEEAFDIPKGKENPEDSPKEEPKPFSDEKTGGIPSLPAGF